MMITAKLSFYLIFLAKSIPFIQPKLISKMIFYKTSPEKNLSKFIKTFLSFLYQLISLRHV